MAYQQLSSDELLSIIDKLVGILNHDTRLQEIEIFGLHEAKEMLREGFLVLHSLHDRALEEEKGKQ